VKRATPTILAKVLLVVGAAIWHAWVVMPQAPVGVLVGVFPFYLLILAWDFLRLILVVPVLLVISWLAIDSGIGFRHSTSSTGAVALAVQSLLACCVVGIAIVLRVLIPAKKGKRSEGSTP